MPSRLRRIYGMRDFHFITCSCYRRQPLMATRHARDVFLRIFEQVRRKYKFEVVGFVVMPEHFHILIGEPETGDPSTVMQVLKQTVARRLLKTARKRKSDQPMLWRAEDCDMPNRHFWQVRFYDFNVYSNEKRAEKLRYMHENPVKRGLAPSPELWAWSSYRAYHCGEPSIVKIAELDGLRKSRFPEVTNIVLTPPSRKHRARTGHPQFGIGTKIMKR
jgi:REP-associated tyrosine transposase